MPPASEHPYDTGFGDRTLGTHPQFEGAVAVVVGVAPVDRSRGHPEGARLQGQLGYLEVHVTGAGGDRHGAAAETAVGTGHADPRLMDEAQSEGDRAEVGRGLVVHPDDALLAGAEEPAAVPLVIEELQVSDPQLTGAQPGGHLAVAAVAMPAALGLL